MLLILLAQPEFRKLVQLKALEAFSQRLTLRAHSTGLEQNEAKAYIEHHLAIAGRTDAVFTDDVITEIYQQAKGLPRLINPAHAGLRLLEGYLRTAKEPGRFTHARERAVPV